MYRQAFKYISLMEPASMSLDEGMKLIPYLEEIVDSHKLNEDYAFMALIVNIVQRTIDCFNDLREYYEIVMTIIDESAITYKMTESICKKSNGITRS